MKRYNIAIISNSKDAVSETFIANHVKHIPHNNTFIYGTGIPHTTECVKPNFFKKVIHKLFNRRNFQNKYAESELIRILKLKKIDLVFAEYLINGGRVIDVCKKLSIPIIVTALGYDISNKDVIENNKANYKMLFNYCNAVIIVSNHMRANLNKLGCPEEKIVYSPAAPETSFFELKPSFKNKNILAIGRFVDKKGPHLSILAFREVLKKHPDAKLIFAGDGQLLNACRDLVNVFDMSKKVEFLGFITQDQQKELLENSMMFIQHSKVASSGDSEGTPVAILEASASGLPVVSTNHAGIPEVVINNETGYLVEELNYKKMAKKMIYLLDHIDFAKEMGDRAKLFVKENFTLEKHISTIDIEIQKAL